MSWKVSPMREDAQLPLLNPGAIRRAHDGLLVCLLKGRGGMHSSMLSPQLSCLLFCGVRGHELFAFPHATRWEDTWDECLSCALFALRGTKLYLFPRTHIQHETSLRRRITASMILSVRSVSILQSWGVCVDWFKPAFSSDNSVLIPHFVRQHTQHDTSLR